MPGTLFLWRATVAPVLALRRTTVTAADGPWLETALGPAWSDPALHPPARPGDEIVVNVQARELGLGSGGYDVVVVNLTRGLDAAGAGGEHVMKLNYTPLQHAIAPGDGSPDGLRGAVAAIGLHGQLAPLAWTFAESGRTLAYVQTWGGALPGGLSRTVAELRERGLLTTHITAQAAYGGEREAISLPGAIAAALDTADAVVAGPGPGILGSATALGHGGMAALDVAHAGLALGLPVLVAPRMSGSDERERHQGLSHHTRTVLSLVLAPVVVALPDTLQAPGDRHDWRRADGSLDGFPWPQRSMGRDDALFFAAAGAAGRVLAAML
jgi:hypothetical protein